MKNTPPNGRSIFRWRAQIAARSGSALAPSLSHIGAPKATCDDSFTGAADEGRLAHLHPLSLATFAVVNALARACAVDTFRVLAPVVALLSVAVVHLDVDETVTEGDCFSDDGEVLPCDPPRRAARRPCSLSIPLRSPALRGATRPRGPSLLRQDHEAVGRSTCRPRPEPGVAPQPWTCCRPRCRMDARIAVAM